LKNKTFFRDRIPSAGQLEDGLLVVNLRHLGRATQDQFTPVEVIGFELQLEGQVAPVGLLDLAGKHARCEAHLVFNRLRFRRVERKGGGRRVRVG
jgi:hypothetical protein